MITKMPNLSNCTDNFSIILVLFCASCVTILPFLRLVALCILCFSRRPLHTLRGFFRVVREFEHATSFWCHTSVFSAALLLLVFEIKYLSQQFDLSAIIHAATGEIDNEESSIDNKSDLMGSILDMSIGAIEGTIDDANVPLLDIEILPNRNALNALLLIGVLSDVSTWLIRYVFDPGWSEYRVVLNDDNDEDEDESMPLLSGDRDENEASTSSNVKEISSTIEV